jgi:nicotinamidase/pyrazinamidase
MKTAFVDVDTQNDFMLPAGALYVPGAELLLPSIARLNRHAASNRIPLIATMDAHAENDPEFSVWPAHCVAGTFGQKKPLELWLDPHVVEKQALDCFTSPRMHELLRELEADRFVVYGVTTEYCVAFAAHGLLGAGRRVELVTDAVRELRREDADRTFTEFTARGGVLTTLAAVFS